ncbi:hypothetical protein HGM15179_022151 [Zosterops borbonicus]|uniref:Uncharacterized protein n=1 Tax=Zosterops borbonicus TaxID=364589 RepID=A0A8K1FXM1_9PASS|nr:hypothetical protein HGM15179_022151 [Zosterops borbonicus]
MWRTMNMIRKNVARLAGMSRKRRIRDLKEMWRTMNMIRKNVARLAGMSRKVSRRVKASWAGFWSSTDRGLCEGKLLLEMLLGLAKASRTSL